MKMLGRQQIFTQRTLLTITAAAALFKDPFMHYAGCPLIQYTGFDKSYCNTVSKAITATQILVTAGAVGQTIASTSASTIVKKIAVNAYQFTLPAGLGAYVMQSFVYGKTPPIELFSVGTVKSSFEMTVAQFMVQHIFLGVSPVIAGAVCSINIAKATNVLFYSIKGSLVDGRELDSNLIRDGEDYALGYAIARPFYQIGMIANDNNHPVIGASLYFAAPICRGYALGLSAKGSVMIPGKDDGILSNVLDGAAIATASMIRTYLGQIETTPADKPLQLPAEVLSHVVTKHFLTDIIGPGNLVSALLIGTEIVHQLIEHKDGVLEFIQDVAAIHAMGNHTGFAEL